MKNNNSKKIKERIKALFVWRDVSFTAFAKHMTEKTSLPYSQSSLSHKLARETISFKDVVEIADELGYDIMFKPRTDWVALKK